MTENENKVMEFLSIFLEENEEKGLQIIVQPNPDVENVFPEKFIDFVCKEIGNFMQKSLKQLKAVEKNNN